VNFNVNFRTFSSPTNITFVGEFISFY